MKPGPTYIVPISGLLGDPNGGCDALPAPGRPAGLERTYGRFLRHCQRLSTQLTRMGASSTIIGQRSRTVSWRTKHAASITPRHPTGLATPGLPMETVEGKTCRRRCTERAVLSQTSILSRQRTSTTRPEIPSSTIRGLIALKWLTYRRHFGGHSR
jgi:hypothetical protein